MYKWHGCKRKLYRETYSLPAAREGAGGWRRDRSCSLDWEEEEQEEEQEEHDDEEEGGLDVREEGRLIFAN